MSTKQNSESAVDAPPRRIVYTSFCAPARRPSAARLYLFFSSRADVVGGVTYVVLEELELVLAPDDAELSPVVRVLARRAALLLVERACELRAAV
jgi:hypothetical protein